MEITENQVTVAVVYDISKNPIFSSTSEKNDGDVIFPSEIDDIVGAIRKLGFRCIVLDGAKSLLEYQKRDEISVVFNKSKGAIGVDRKSMVPMICKFLSIPIVGSSAYHMALCRHKYHTNNILRGMGYNVPLAQIINYQDKNLKIDFPIFIKPTWEGGALGIDEQSLFFSEKGLYKRVEYLVSNFNQPIIAEEFINGTELKVAILKDKKRDIYFVGCVEILKNSKALKYDYITRKDVLYGSVKYRLPEKSLFLKVSNIAIKIHEDLGLESYSRIDFRHSDQTGETYCIEISTHPDLSIGSSYVSALLQEDINHEHIVSKLIEGALPK